jgi:hypothetical protein
MVMSAPATKVTLQSQAHARSPLRFVIFISDTVNVSGKTGLARPVFVSPVLFDA